MWADTWRRRPRAVGVLAAAGLVAALAGCGSSDTDADPQPTLELSETSTPDEAPSSDPVDESTPGTPGVPDPRPAPTAGEKLDDEYGVYALKLPGEGTKATVAQTLVDYIDVRNRSFFEQEAPLQEIARLSVGQPLTEIQAYVREIDEAGEHTVGDFWLTVRGKNVSVDGKEATLRNVCALNATANVNDDLVAQESPSDAYLLDATAVKAARDVWLISSIAYDPVSSC